MAVTETFISGETGRKLHLLSGQFSIIIRDSLALTAIGRPTDVEWDGTNTLSGGYDSSKVHLHSGKFSSTVKSSADVIGLGVASLMGMSSDSNNDSTPLAGDTSLFLMSGQFTSTLKTSLDVSGVDTSPQGISGQFENTPWCGQQAQKLYLASGKFSITLKDSSDQSVIGGMNGISFNGTDTPWMTNTGAKIFLQSGQFSETVKTSLAIGSVQSWPTGNSMDDATSRLADQSASSFTPTAVIF